MFFCGCRTVVRCLWSRQFEYNETAEKPPTGRFFWKVNIVCFLGCFSLTKAPSFAIQILNCKIHPQRRFHGKGVAHSAECALGRCPKNPRAFCKKLDKNFLTGFVAKKQGGQQI